MKLRVLDPTEIIVYREVSKIIAEAENGFFCLLPHHIDFVSALVCGILTFVPVPPDMAEEYVAVDEGIMVKCGDDVTVTTSQAFYSKNLATIKQTLEEKFRELDERERNTRAILAKLETDLMRQMLQQRK